MGDWQKTFEEKLSPLFSVKETLSDDEAGKMGRKDPEQEVEKFVSANTQELGKDKWLCPLSGKKFKVGGWFSLVWLFLTGFTFILLKIFKGAQKDIQRPNIKIEAVSYLVSGIIQLPLSFAGP